MDAVTHGQPTDSVQLVPFLEALHLLGISRRTFDRLREHDATIPTPLRIGRRKLAFRRTDLERFVASRPARGDW